MSRIGSLALAVAVTACGQPGTTSSRPEPPAPPAKPAGNETAAAGAVRKLDAETKATTTTGATFTAPAGWWLSEGKVIKLEDPDRELSLWLLEVEADDRASAVAKGWKAIDPAFSRQVARDDEFPARDGWDAVGQTVYVTPAAESRSVVAFARRKGKTWQLTLIDAKDAALGRRGAQLNAIVDSIALPGVEKETLAGRPAHIDTERLARWAEFVDEARQLAEVPGAAVAVVHGGKIVFERGFGVRQQGKRARVTPRTRFMIGSTTKSLTTLMMARQVDQGRYAWETPVTKVLPAFALGDAATTGSLQMRHTVCACTGMPRQDLEFVFEFAGWDPERRLGSLAAMKPTTGFGETFQYSNLMVSSGGYAAAHAHAPNKKLGPAYDAALQELVLNPLGMKDTTLDYRRASRGDAAHGHARDLTAAPQAIGLELERAIIPVRPAGGAWSTVRDMARYLQVELAQGALPGGKQLVSAANIAARRAPQVAITADVSYGLGLFVSRESGITAIGHGGNTFGFTSEMMFLPDHDIGLVILTNVASANAFTDAAKRRLLEIVFDGEPEAEENLKAAVARRKKNAAEQNELVRATPDAAWLEPLLGSYRDPSLGAITIARAGSRVVIEAGEWKADLAQMVDRDGTAKLVLTSPPLAGLELVPRDKDGAKVLVLDAGQQVYTFVREP